MNLVNTEEGRLPSLLFFCNFVNFKFNGNDAGNLDYYVFYEIYKGDYKRENRTKNYNVYYFNDQ